MPIKRSRKFIQWWVYRRYQDAPADAWDGPYSSRREAEREAKRLNYGSDPQWFDYVVVCSISHCAIPLRWEE